LLSFDPMRHFELGRVNFGDVGLTLVAVRDQTVLQLVGVLVNTLLNGCLP